MIELKGGSRTKFARIVCVSALYITEIVRHVFECTILEYALNINVNSEI